MLPKLLKGGNYLRKYDTYLEMDLSWPYLFLLKKLIIFFFSSSIANFMVSSKTFSTWEEDSFQVCKYFAPSKFFFTPLDVVKVSSFRKQIVKPWILPKNEWMNSFLLVCEVFSFVFRENPKPEKKCFEIIWPLTQTEQHFWWSHT